MQALRDMLRGWRGRDELGDEALVALARKGDEAAVRALVKRHNQRLYRVARGVVATDAEAEDVVQEAYTRAFTRLDGFRGDAAFPTWLTRIALNEAYGRLRRDRDHVGVEQIDAAGAFGQGNVVMFSTTPSSNDPESDAGREQVRQVLERAIDELPEAFRIVFVLREIQGLSTEETADVLSIAAGTVKTRLHRARRLMRLALEKALSPRFSEVFPFAGERCGRIADRVVERLRLRASPLDVR